MGKAGREPRASGPVRSAAARAWPSSRRLKMERGLLAPKPRSEEPGSPPQLWTGRFRGRLRRCWRPRVRFDLLPGRRPPLATRAFLGQARDAGCPRAGMEGALAPCRSGSAGPGVAPFPACSALGFCFPSDPWAVIL